MIAVDSSLYFKAFAPFEHEGKSLPFELSLALSFTFIKVYVIVDDSFSVSCCQLKKLAQL